MSKDHDTKYATPKKGEGGPNGVAVGVSFACSWSRYCFELLFDDLKWWESSACPQNLVKHVRVR